MKARIAGVFYLLTFVTGILAMAATRNGMTANLAATVCYVGVTVLFYGIFKPVSPGLSLLAAIVSLVACVYGALKIFHVVTFEMSNLPFFGIYCLLIGYLILRSTFLPRVLGVLMAFGGVGWLTFAVPSLARQLAPFNMIPGMVGEAALTVWLLAFGVNEERWRARAAVGESRRGT